MAGSLVPKTVSVIVLAAIVGVGAAAPAAGADRKTGTVGAGQPRPAPKGTTASAAAPDVAAAMTPQITPVQVEGKSCADIRPGTVVVTNVGKVRAEGVSVGISLRLGDGPFTTTAPQGPVTLEPGKSATMVLDAETFSRTWCPGQPSVTWRAWADDAQKLREPDEKNNLADKTYPPPIPLQPTPKKRKQGGTP
jgi:hypothetical protein